MTVTTRRAFLAHSAAFLAVPLAAEAQQAVKVYHIGVLSQGSRSSLDQRWESGLIHALSRLGWKPDQEIVFARRYAEGNEEQLQNLARELTDLNPNVIVTVGPPATSAARKATSAIPIVFIGIVDPVALGFVQSVARPGGNITGAALTVGPEMAAKQLELLREADPRTSHVALLYNLASRPAALYLPSVETAAKQLGVVVRPFGIAGPESLEAVLLQILDSRAEGLFVIGDPLTLALRHRVVGFAAKSRLPTVYGVRQFVDDGGLMSYSWSDAEIIQWLAATVDKILRGVKVADIPVVQPARYELVINLKTAKALGLTIPRSLLARADQVIE